jgi:hypothetical protein
MSTAYGHSVCAQCMRTVYAYSTVPSFVKESRVIENEI